MSQAYATSSLRQALRQSLVVLCACTIVGVGFLGLHQSVAKAMPLVPQSSYDCAANHCYGANLWQGNVNGAETNIKIVNMTCSGCANDNGFENNEIWILSQYASYWVEVGFTTWATGSTVYNAYFWADLRPGYSYREFPFVAIPSADYGYTGFFQLYRINSSTWSETFNSAYEAGTNNSSYDTFTPYYIEIGLELYGDSAWTAFTSPYTTFTYNEWRGLNNNWNFQNQNNELRAGNPGPIYSGWVTYPYQSKTGGSFYTQCVAGVC
jgi:hypothetical protein